jgi:uncharacterized membrane protein
MNADKYDKKILTAYALTGALLLILLLIVPFLDEAVKVEFLSEEGPVESASALGYLLCAIFAAYNGGIAYFKRHHYFFILLVFFMLRELDFDKRFTTIGVLTSRFYISDSVPAIEKLLGGVVVGLLLYVVIVILQRHFKQFWLGLKRRSTISLGVLLAAILIFVSKSLDGIGRKLKPLGIEISEAAIFNVTAIEEILEFSIPIIIAITFHAYFEKLKVQQYAAPDGDSAALLRRR